MSNENQNNPENTNPNPQLPENRAPRRAAVRGGSARQQQNAAPPPPADNAEPEPSVIVGEVMHAEPSRPAVAGSNARPVDHTRSIEQQPATRTVNHGDGAQVYDDFGPARRSRGWIWAAIALALVLGAVGIFLGATSKEKLNEIADKVDDPVTGLEQRAMASGVRKLLEENYYTKTDVDNKFVSTEALVKKGYVTATELNEKLKGYAKTDDVDAKLKGVTDQVGELDKKVKGVVTWGQLRAREAKAKLEMEEKLKTFATKAELDELTKVRVEIRDSSNKTRDALTVP